jgi:hypothetical protein
MLEDVVIVEIPKLGTQSTFVRITRDTKPHQRKFWVNYHNKQKMLLKKYLLKFAKILKENAFCSIMLKRNA